MSERDPHTGRCERSPPSGAYSWYVVFVLMLCQLLAAIDTHLPFILVEALKADLGLSDTQIGLINGPAFSLVYATAAIAVARLSDRGNRVAIISTAIILWSGFTAAAGLACGFGGMAVTRIGLAAGESALTPAAHSLIASYLPREARAKGIAIYSFGIAAGAFVAFAAGGYIGDRFGWRVAFLAVGGMGLFLAVLLRATVREPVRDSVPSVAPTLRGSVSRLLQHPVIRNLVLGGALFGFSSGGVAGCAPAYVMRTFGLSATDTGISYGLVLGLTAMVGILAGGFIASWLSERNPRYALQMMALALILATMTQTGAFLVESYGLFLMLMTLTVLLSSFYIGPTFAAIQSVVNESERSFASAVALFCINGMGIAAGAFVVGLMSDLLSGWAVTDSLKWSLLALSLVKAWSALHYWLASRGMSAPDEVSGPNQEAPAISS